MKILGFNIGKKKQSPENSTEKNIVEPVDDEKQKIEKEMGLTIKKTELVEVNSDIIEYGIDEVLSDGILKDIPIVSILNSGYRIQKTIRSGLFLKRILKFLFELNTTTIEEREEYINQINAEDKFVNKVGEQLIMIIEKIDDYDKAHIIGKLFRSSIKGEFSCDEFVYLSHIVNNTYSKHLIKLKSTEDKGKFYIHRLSEMERESLIRSGLMYQPDVKKKIRASLKRANRFKTGANPATLVSDAFQRSKKLC